MHGGFTAGEGEIALFDHHRLNVDAVRDQRFAITIAAGGAGAVGRITEDHGKAAVAEFQQMFGGFARGRRVVKQRRGPAFGLQLRRDPAIGNARRIEPVEHRDLVAAGRGQHHTIERGRTQERKKLVWPGADIAERQDDHAPAFVGQPFQHTALQFDDIARARAFVGQPQHEAAPCDQALGSDIGLIIELLRNRLDPFAHRLLDERFVIQDARDSLGRHPGSSCDFIDRGAAGNGRSPEKAREPLRETRRFCKLERAHQRL